MKERLTKEEACQRLGIHLSTLDRMIKKRTKWRPSWSPRAPDTGYMSSWTKRKRQERIRTRRPTQQGTCQLTQRIRRNVIVLRERVKSLEEMVSYYQQHLKDAEWRYGQLQANLTTSPEHAGSSNHQGPGRPINTDKTKLVAMAAVRRRPTAPASNARVSDHPSATNNPGSVRLAST